MKKMMVLIAACAGAAGTFFWLRGGDLGQVREKAKRAMGQAAGAMSDAGDELSRRDGSAPGYVPAHAPGA